VYLLVVVLAGAALISSAYLYREKQHDQELAATNQTLSTTLVQMQNRLQDLTQQIGDLKSPPAAAVRVARAEPAKSRPVKASPVKGSKIAAQRTPPRDDPRFQELQGQLSDQQKQLASTRDDLDKTRDDLSGALSSTRDELSGSIAKTHEELVALQKRGERNYYEFELSKSKEFQRVGPLRLALRKADTKHKRFDMNLFVDDSQLEKKGVNLYETIWINTGDRPQPMELVVNRITKDHIQGYLSEPKYKKSELSQTVDAATQP
jgi:predicted  nucleic acid-binding Zn-ribbon protein